MRHETHPLLESLHPRRYIRPSLIPRIIEPIDKYPALYLDLLVRRNMVLGHLFLHVRIEVVVQAEPVHLARRAVVDGGIRMQCCCPPMAHGARRERVHGTHFNRDDTDRDGVLDQSLNVWFEPRAALPFFDLLSPLEVRSEMIHSFGPVCQCAVAKSTTGAYFVVIGDPRIHGWSMVGALLVKESKMLPKMILAEECPGERGLFGTGGIVVVFEVPSPGIELAAENASDASVLTRTLRGTSAMP